MFGLGFTFFVNSLCALSDTICLPLYQSVVPEPSSSYVDSLRMQSPAVWNYRLPIVETKLGLIEGYQMQTIRNRSIFAFEGVRYAEPPLGKLRFREPVPIRKPWRHLQQALRFRSACLQMDATQYFRIYGNEDCLFINVYTPVLPDPLESSASELLPVIAYIHGGGHFFGTSGQYGPAYLLDTLNVLLVTFNYRLGVLGYLSTGDSAAPGNNALKDQALALRWIQENIDQFGGDPARITLMGQSAGSVAVGLHLVSPQTRNIPIRAIMHSGDPLSNWGLINRTFASTKALANRAGCPTHDNHQLVTCLQRLNANTVVQKQFEIYKKYIFPLFTFGPVVEHQHPGAFLLESPEMAYARGNVSRVPLLQGFVPNEGDFLAAIAYLLRIDTALNRDFDNSMPLALDIEDKSPAETKAILRAIDAEYLHGQALTFWSRAKFSSFFGDRYFMVGIRKGLEFHSKLAPTYGFIFDHKGRYSSLESLGLQVRDWGISHIDDLQYLLNSTLYFKALKTSDPDFRVAEFMVNVWGNFVNKGRPVYTNEAGQEIEFWSPVNPALRVPNIVRLTDALYKSQMIEFPFERRYQLWKSFKLRDDLPIKVNARPFDIDDRINLEDFNTNSNNFLNSD